MKLDGNAHALGWLAAAISRLRPYDLIADDNRAADIINETPTMSATITDMFFIKWRANYLNPIELEGNRKGSCQ